MTTYRIKCPQKLAIGQTFAFQGRIVIVLNTYHSDASDMYVAIVGVV